MAMHAYPLDCFKYDTEIAVALFEMVWYCGSSDF